jgi:hypothetical protein
METRISFAFLQDLVSRNFDLNSATEDEEILSEMKRLALFYSNPLNDALTNIQGQIEQVKGNYL